MCILGFIDAETTQEAEHHQEAEDQPLGPDTGGGGGEDDRQLWGFWFDAWWTEDGWTLDWGGEGWRWVEQSNEREIERERLTASNWLVLARMCQILMGGQSWREIQ